MKPDRLASCAALIAFCSPFAAQATVGVFEHGNGIKSMGMGGVGYSFAEETTALGANPAHALALSHRFDVGVDLFAAEAVATYDGNAAGPDESFASDGRTYYAIPQGGYSRRLSDRLGFGVTVLSAGLGPDYDGSPYERFGGSSRVSLGLASSSVVTALAYQLNKQHTVGASLNVGYQVLELKGLQFLDDPAVSSAPGKVTNQGKDGAFSVGFSLGWHGQLTPWLAAGVAYRSKSWTEKHEDYRGLVAEGGRLELPAIYGGGVTLTPIRNWTLALEFQHQAYSKEPAFSNKIEKLAEGNLLGSDNGPGFGLDDANVYKIGVRWQATPKLMLRAGYTYNTVIVQRSETLFAVLGCLTTSTNYSVGATYQIDDKWEVSAFAFDTPKRSVRGENSIPAEFGGGEITVSDKVSGIGFSLGRRF